MSEHELLHQHLSDELQKRFRSSAKLFSFDGWRQHTKDKGRALTMQEAQLVVGQAIETLQNLYVHMDLKRTRRGVDPVRQLLVFREQLRTAEAREAGENPPTSEWDPRTFHKRMLEIFKTLGDVHTAYRLPDPWKHAIAFLPFILARFVEGGEPRYVVTRTLWDGCDWGLKGFERGTEVVSWNGMPMDEAVRRSAELEEGSTTAHDLALGLQVMTVRWLGASFEPDSPWVIVGYRPPRQKAAVEGRFFWSVLREDEAVPLITAQAVPMIFKPAPVRAPVPVQSRVSLEMRRQERSRSAHIASEVVHRGRKTLFVPGQPVSPKRLEDLGDELSSKFARPVGQTQLRGFTESNGELRSNNGEFPTLLPEWLEAREHEGERLLHYLETLNPKIKELVTSDLRATIASKRFGYLGIRAFPLEGKARRIFKYELRRLLSLMPEDGLIVDVRDNPGGSAELAEQSLQFFTPKVIAPLPFRFIASESTRKITKNRDEFKPYIASIDNALSTGAAFSAGVPISSAEAANALGQYYFGPVVLVTNGVTYSAGDLFAAGFQDNQVGTVIGIDETTGGGGANCWFYEENIRRALGQDPLPHEINLQIAVRQCARIGTSNLGVPIEEIGAITPPENRHSLKREDILGDSRRPWSLLLRCAVVLAQKPSYDLQAKFEILDLPDGGRERIVKVKTRGITRLDFYVNGRPTAVNVEGNGDAPQTKFALPIRGNERLDLQILGYAPGTHREELVARYVRVFQDESSSDEERPATAAVATRAR